MWRLRLGVFPLCDDQLHGSPALPPRLGDAVHPPRPAHAISRCELQEGSGEGRGGGTGSNPKLMITRATPIFMYTPTNISNQVPFLLTARMASKRCRATCFQWPHCEMPSWRSRNICGTGQKVGPNHPRFAWWFHWFKMVQEVSIIFLIILFLIFWDDHFQDQ